MAAYDGTNYFLQALPFFAYLSAATTSPFPLLGFAAIFLA